MSSSAAASSRPASTGVSYVIPVLNEEGYLERAVRSVWAQDHEGPSQLVLALGPSADRSTAIAEELAAADARITLVHNPAADIPIGLNLAVRASRFPVIVRVDAHSELPPEYTRLALSALARTGAANVGGVMLAQGHSPFQRAVARAYASRFGLGGGAYHRRGTAGPAESAYLGVFRREALEAIGLFDETIRRGEDWELNLRLREAGHLVWFDPALEVTYWPRESWAKLVRQFVATGTWRGELVRRYGGKNPLRFFAPPALVVVLVLCVVLAALQATGVLTGWVSAVASALYLGPLAYLALLAYVALKQPVPARERALFAGVLVTMHLAWGAGFCRGILRGAKHTVDTSRTENPAPSAAARD